MKFPVSVFLVSAIAVAGQDIATPPVPLEPSAPDSASAVTTAHPAPVELPHAIAQPIALRVVGSNVKNPGGEYLGRIDNVVIDGESARTEYAMVVVNYPTNNNLYTPVPWGALSYMWDQAQAGGTPGALQVFLLNIDRATLERAPTLDRTQWSAIREPEFAQQLAAFYGPTDASAVGAAGTAGGTVAGAGAGGPTLPAGAGIAPDSGFGVPYPVTGFPFLVSPGFVVLDTNFVGTNIVINTNVVVTNLPGGIQTNIVINLTNFPPEVASNVLAGNLRPGTNSFAGTPGFLGGRFRPPGINSDTNLPPTGGTNIGGGVRPSGTNFAGTPGFLGGRFAPAGINPSTNAAAAAVGPGPLPGASAVPGTPTGIGAPTGRSIQTPGAMTPTIPPQTPLPTIPSPAQRPTVAPQTPLPAMPGSGQQPSVPPSATPPGTAVPQAPAPPPAVAPPQ